MEKGTPEKAKQSGIEAETPTTSPPRKINLHAAIIHEHELDNGDRRAKTKLVNKEGIYTPPKNLLCTIDDLRAIQTEHQEKENNSNVEVMTETNEEQVARRDGFIKVTYKKKKPNNKEGSLRVTRAHNKKV